MLKVYDDLFTDDFIMEMSKAAHRLPWKYTNVANRNQFPVSSMFAKGTHRFFGSVLWDDKGGYNIENNTPKEFMDVLDFFLDKGFFDENVRMHSIDANLQVYGQDGTGHIDDFMADGTDRTVLLYCHHEWKEEWGGALEILNEDEEVIESILPMPGRVVYLDSSVLHRARAPLVKDVARMSIAYRMQAI